MSTRTLFFWLAMMATIVGCSACPSEGPSCSNGLTVRFSPDDLADEPTARVCLDGSCVDVAVDDLERPGTTLYGLNGERVAVTGDVAIANQFPSGAWAVGSHEVRSAFDGTVSVRASLGDAETKPTTVKPTPKTCGEDCEEVELAYDRSSATLESV
jgi:hypothetical protein